MRYIATEKDVERTLKDYVIFCEYIRENHPTITKKGSLSKKACFEVNALLSRPEVDVKPNSMAARYPSVCLWYEIAMNSFMIEIDNKGKPGLCLSQSYDYFKQANPFTQYLIIFATWFLSVDPKKIYDAPHRKAILSTAIIDDFFEKMSNAENQQWIENKEDQGSEADLIQVVINQYDKLVQIFGDLGLLDYKTGLKESVSPPRKMIEKMKATAFGLSMMHACGTRRFEWLSEYGFEIMSFDKMALLEQEIAKIEKDPTCLLDPFLAVFPENTIDTDLLAKFGFGVVKGTAREKNGIVREENPQVFEVKVLLEKGCYCKIRLSGAHTFEDLHLAIQDAYHFDDDHLYAFYLNGKIGSQGAINDSRTEEPPFAHEVRLCDAPLRKKQHILYVFDFGDEWRFDVTVTAIEETNAPPLTPEIVEFVGTAPKQYGDEEDWEDWED